MNQKIDVIDDRYVIGPETPRPGGMSVVSKAYDTKTGHHVAIKYLIAKSDELKAQEAFAREYKVLEEIQHPNVVQYIDAGIDKNRKKYIVLEWVDENLEDHIFKRGQIRWDEYFSQIGRPILDVIKYFQARKIVHRDIKPKNILITSAGIPKVADYGISKIQDGKFNNGQTFMAFGSPPFTPKEDDDGRYSFSRDTFSFAAVTVFSLSGPFFTKEEEDKQQISKEMRYARLMDRLSSISIDRQLRDILQKALSDNPTERFQSASNLLSAIENFEDSRRSIRGNRIPCQLILEADVSSKILRRQKLSTATEVEHFIAAELNERSSIERYRFRDGVVVDAELTIWGVTWGYRVKQSANVATALCIIDAWPMGAAEVERLREKACAIPIDFRFGSINPAERPANLISSIFSAVASHESKAEAEQIERDQKRYFRTLSSFLSAKSELAKASQDALEYDGRNIVGEIATLKLTYAADPSAVGDERIIRLPSQFIIQCEIQAVRGRQVDVRPINASPLDIPLSGRLCLDVAQNLKSIERQRFALDTVFYDRAVSPRLKEILLNPSSSRPPTPIDGVAQPASKIDDDKMGALLKALGTQDMLAIEGPPGTGKTELITEIIVRYIERNPAHRILLSAQTHIALDNVIERISKATTNLKIVRIARSDDRKVSESSRPFLLEKRLQSWTKEVISKAESFIAAWAEKRGLDRNQISIGIHVERLIRILDARTEIEAKRREASEKNADADSAQKALIEREGGITSDDLDYTREEAQTEMSRLDKVLKKLRETEAESRAALSKLGEYGQELHKLDAVDLRGWLDLFLPGTDAAKEFRTYLEIFEDWIFRVGRSSDFQPAVIGTSQIIAGTCIGMASVKGLQQVSFDLCIVDEASKATATEALVPMSRARRWILVGDPKQLPPFFEDEFRRESSLLNDFDIKMEEVKETLLDRMLQGLPDESKSSLTHQYRMIEDIGNLVSECFYGGRLDSPIKKSQIILSPLFNKHVTWLTTSSRSDRYETPEGASYSNTCEIQAIVDTVKCIAFVARTKRKSIEVGIIAGYGAQVESIERRLQGERGELRGVTITCATVDSFQGRQVDVCLYSVTRSNQQRKIGFLRELPRLNVALSRAKSYLIIIGDHLFCKTASGDNPFTSVIGYVENQIETCELRNVT